MNGPELSIIEGTTFSFGVTWEDSGTPRSPIDIEGCAAVFRICPATSSQALAECSTEDGGITIGPDKGQLSVRLAPEKTSGTSGALWLGARYELRVSYPSGDVYSLVRGQVRLIPAVIE